MAYLTGGEAHACVDLCYLVTHCTTVMVVYFANERVFFTDEGVVVSCPVPYFHKM